MNIRLHILGIFLLAAVTASESGELEKAKHFLSTREFSDALSIYGEILQRDPGDTSALRGRAAGYTLMRDWRGAVAAWSDLLEAIPLDYEGNVERWLAMVRAAGEDSGNAEKAREQVGKEARGFLANVSERERAYSLALDGMKISDADSTFIAEVEGVIVDSFPLSEKAYEIARENFYDGLYPIWRDDTLKIRFLDAFLNDYPVEDWRLTVYQFLLSSLKRLDDAEGVRLYGERMLSEDSLNPFAYDYLSYLLLEMDIDTARALELSVKAVDLEPLYRKPVHKPDAQWELEKPPLAATARREMATALMALGRLSEAEVWAREALGVYVPDINNFATRASLFFTLGKIQELRGGTEEAMASYVNAVTEGDMTNKWTAKADSSLRRLYSNMHGSDDGLLDYARRVADYMGITFTDVSKDAGLGERRESRIAWADFDNDGFDDILLAGRVLFLNCDGDSFRDFTDSSGIRVGGVTGAVCADFDNDGNMDFYAISGGKGDDTDRLWKGNGDGTFIDITGTAGEVADTLSTEGAAWADCDLDGYVDLYCANYEVWGKVSGLEDRLYHNNGNGTFTRVGKRSGAVPPFGEDRAGRGVNWGDFDNDGDPDIYVSNYRLQENFLFENRGDGTFDNMAARLGVAGEEVDGWWGHTIGSEWGDYDNDGDLDLVAANLAHPRYIEFSDKTMLYENTGPPRWEFADVRERAGIKYDETHSDPSWGDVDGDGDLDLYITSIYEERRSFLYENLGNGKFRDITWLAGVRAYNGWGCAFSDYDNDGDLDLFVASGSGGHLFRNDGHRNNWIAISLKGGKKSNRACIGARVVVKQGSRTQIREVEGGKGTTSQHSLTQFFGLGAHSEPVDILVSFPSGRTQVRKSVSANEKITVEEE